MASVNGIPSDGPWFLAKGKTSMIRARQDLLPAVLGAGLNERVVVTWQCRNPLSSGLPSNTDYAEIKEFEGLIVRFLEDGALLAFVLTEDGAVNMNFYTSDTGWFVERLNEALEDKPVQPIELTAESDPDWAEYRAMLEATGMSVASGGQAPNHSGSNED
jgi:hypothetical protein